jgi:predicted lipoprotein
VVSKATELSVVLVAINVNTTSAEKQYGYEEGEGPYTFMVKGKGRVTAVQTGSENGTLSITPVPSLGKDQPEIVIQIGPVVTGTAIRDGVGFIHFEQFVNQIQYAQVADALNTHVPLLLGNTNPASLQGKTLTYYGLFQLVNPKRIVITPVKLEIGGNSQ